MKLKIAVVRLLLVGQRSLSGHHRQEAGFALDLGEVSG
jgi:hypothetical protein